jgi:hypothetical protein
MLNTKSLTHFPTPHLLLFQTIIPIPPAFSISIALLTNVQIYTSQPSQVDQTPLRTKTIEPLTSFLFCTSPQPFNGSMTTNLPTSQDFVK